MSDTILVFIPTDATYVPESLLRQEAQLLLASFLPHAEEIRVSVTDSPEFVATGGNFEAISCPGCGSNVDMDWWTHAVDTAYVQTKFESLVVKMPCCSKTYSLNDLNYDRLTGFARFKVEIRNPGQGIDEEQTRMLERILACPIKVIWGHF